MASAAADPTHPFVALMGAMRDHYRGGAQGPFDMTTSPHARALLVSAASDAAARPAGIFRDGPDPLSQIRATARGGASDSVSRQQSGAQAAATQVQQDKDSQSFLDKMNAQRDQAKKDSDANIDTAYDSAIKLGKNASPEQQNQIANGMQTLMTGLNGIIGTLTDVIGTIVGAVTDIIDAILKPIEGIAKEFGPVLGLVALL